MGTTAVAGSGVASAIPGVGHAQGVAVGMGKMVGVGSGVGVSLGEGLAVGVIVVVGAGVCVCVGNIAETPTGDWAAAVAAREGSLDLRGAGRVFPGSTVAPVATRGLEVGAGLGVG